MSAYLIMFAFLMKKCCIHVFIYIHIFIRYIIVSGWFHFHGVCVCMFGLMFAVWREWIIILRKYLYTIVIFMVIFSLSQFCIAAPL